VQITVTGRHMELTPTLKDHVQSKVSKLNKYLENILEAHVVLSVEKYRHIAEITIHMDGVNITGKGETDDMYASIDQVLEKIEHQITKRKSKHRTPSNRKENIEQKLSNNLTALEERNSLETETFAGQLVKSSRFEPKPMSPAEAVMQLKVSYDQFLVFANSTTNVINVVYKKKDGNFGLIEPDITHNH